MPALARGPPSFLCLAPLGLTPSPRAPFHLPVGAAPAPARLLPPGFGSVSVPSVAVLTPSPPLASRPLSAPQHFRRGYGCLGCSQLGVLQTALRGHLCRFGAPAWLRRGWQVPGVGRTATAWGRPPREAAWGGASPCLLSRHSARQPRRPAPPAWGSPSAGCRCGSNPQPQPEPPRRLPLGCSRRSLSPPDPPAPPPLCTQQTGHQGRVSRRNSKPSGSPLLPGTCEPPHVRTPVSPCHGGAAFLSRGEVLRTSSLLYAGGTV